MAEKETIKISGMSEGELFYVLSEARATARVVWTILNDAQAVELDAVAAHTNGVDGGDLLILALLASSKADEAYAALFDPSAVTAAKSETEGCREAD